MKVIGNADKQETGRWLNNRREFTPAVSTKRASHVALPPNAKFAKVRRRAFLNSQPFQPGKTPL
jgi:hypothetical protein